VEGGRGLRRSSIELEGTILGRCLGEHLRIHLQYIKSKIHEGINSDFFNSLLMSISPSIIHIVIVLVFNPA
jgi:hypothetical protein